MSTATQEKPKTQTAEPPAGEQTAAFDKTRYDDPELRISKVDGQGIDKIRVAFTGSVMLDRSNPQDVALFNKLILGREVELRCAGSISKTSTGWTTNREGDLDSIVGERTVKVETVWVMDATEL